MKIAVLVVAFVMSAWSSAWPCGNPVVLAGDQAVQRVKAAERRLDRGDARGAARMMRAIWIRDEALEARAALVRATARMRIVYAPHADAAARAETILDIVDGFEELITDRPGEPLLQARLAEALAPGDAAQRSRAASLIDDLVARDLMPDARAWRTAAQLRAAAGDADGAAAALATCVTRGGTRRVCRLESTR